MEPGQQSTVINVSIFNTRTKNDADDFTEACNITIKGPPRVLLDRVAFHLKRACYKIVSLSIGGPIDYQSTCVIVISTSLSRNELRRRGFEWHGLDDISNPAKTTPCSQSEIDELDRVVRSDESLEIVRIDFSNGHWKSSFNLVRAGYHAASIERTLILIDEHVKKGCYLIESLFTVNNWCSICIDTDLTQHELRAKGFQWHGLDPRQGEDDRDRAIVMPGWNRAEDFWEDEDGVKHYEASERRDL